jgi:hypothetical protein
MPAALTIMMRRHVNLGCERRTVARAIAAQDPEPARTDVVEDAVSPMMVIALRCTKMTVEKASGLRPAAVAMAQAGSERLFADASRPLDSRIPIP